MGNESDNLLRNLHSLAGPFPQWDMEKLPARPGLLFLDWLRCAMDNDVKEPHAMALSTVDAEGYPDARVLILKQIVGDSFYFASSSASRKGQQLQGNPHVALTFYWPVLGRQIRVRGIVQDQGDEAGADDFRQRSMGARAVAMTERQSQVLDSEESVDSSVAAQKNRIARNPEVITPQWRLYAVDPQEVEFWQGDPERKHKRIRYVKQGSQWKIVRLWP
ncbi:pyridoxamine 5'-phosphate oxidase [Paenibacillus sp. 598K]|uniref:pyridoxine/pyridoxamine 5'-phosphate oxidase n=1 Tax=Paenibacillus sp. 598K TaxID=1117987 RepID=UPI000FFA3F65|nr:pyridoxal 5'-phosphate synthase [Paenibacillus sp. 598K]GBF74329.1 pyridoxamine 5'-phosphate oxidase [Paenibacillus sp. 598K]